MADKKQELEKLLSELDTDRKNGLSNAQAAERLKKEGKNSIPLPEAPHFYQRLAARARNPVMAAFTASVFVSVMVSLYRKNSFLDALAMLAIVLAGMAVELWQLQQAERMLERERGLPQAMARVIRDDKLTCIPEEELVRGDIVVLQKGDRIPADLRLLETVGLQCGEEALTGESTPVDKDAWANVLDSAAPPERWNMAFCGCRVLAGRATGVVTATGETMEICKNGKAVEEQQSLPWSDLAIAGERLSQGIYIVCTAMLLAGILRGANLLEVLVAALALAVLASPERITPIIAAVSATGMRRLEEGGILVRRLPVLETMGKAGVICSNKTTLLDQEQLAVRELWAAGRSPQSMEDSLSAPSLHVLRLAALCSEAMEEKDDAGDTVDRAILSAALEKGLEKEVLLREYPPLSDIPFDPRRGCVTSVHLVGEKPVAVVKGSFDRLWPHCTHNRDEKAEEIAQSMEEKGLQVIAVACRELPVAPWAPTPEMVERELTFVGFVGISNLPGEEAQDAVELCHRAGIRLVLMTGEQLATTKYIAQKLGILAEGGQLLTGEQISWMEQKELEQAAAACSVYAKTGPEEQLRVVKAWQQQGTVAVVAGTDPEDVPAVKESSIGCAVGARSADSTREAADVVLPDENISAMVDMIRLGRSIMVNMRGAVQLMLTGMLGETAALFIAVLLGWGTPVLAAQLLLANLICILLPAMAIGREPVDKDTMKSGPPEQNFLLAGIAGWVAVLQGLITAGLVLSGYAIGAFAGISRYFPPSRQAGVTMAFLVLALSGMVQAFGCRSTKSVFRIGLFSNKAMTKVFLCSLAALLLVTWVPALESIFGLTDLSVAHWLLVLLLSLFPLLAGEIIKAFYAVRDRFV